MQSTMIYIVFMLLVVYHEIAPGACNALPEQRCHTATGRCYWLDPTTHQTWEEARTSCKSMAGDLAVMETRELWDFVVSEFT